MKAYMDDITPKNATLANNAAWKWIHKSMGTSLELFEPEVVEPESTEFDFPKEDTPPPEPDVDPLSDPEEKSEPEIITEKMEADLIMDSVSEEPEKPIKDIKDEDIKKIKLEDK